MMPNIASTQSSSRIHPLSLVIAVTIMLACTLYPPMMAAADGKVDHVLAAALFAAMSVGFVKGVGLSRGRSLGGGFSQAGHALQHLRLLGG